MPSENDALLERNYATNGALTREATAARERRHARVRAVVSTILVVLFLVGVPLMLFLGEEGSGRTGLSKDPLKAAHQVLKSTPVIVSTRVCVCAWRRKDVDAICRTGTLVTLSLCISRSWVPDLRSRPS